MSFENHANSIILECFLSSVVARVSELPEKLPNFTATMETTIHEEKISHFTFHGKRKRPDHESRKYPLPSSCVNNYFETAKS